MQTMKIGEVATRLNTTIRTLRFYEEEGLIHPARSPGGTRRYEEEDMERFAAILRFTRLGIPLAELRRLVAIPSNSTHGGEASRQIDTLLVSLSSKLEQQRNEIADLSQDIDEARRHLAACFECEKEPNRINCSSCAVGTVLMQTQVMRVVWDRD